MIRLIQVIRVGLLLVAVAFLALSALPGSVGADPVPVDPSDPSGTNCAGPGETCHAIIHGQIHHFKDLGGT